MLASVRHQDIGEQLKTMQLNVLNHSVSKHSGLSLKSVCLCTGGVYSDACLIHADSHVKSNFACASIFLGTLEKIYIDCFDVTMLFLMSLR
jgi:hypothetical protein